MTDQGETDLATDLFHLSLMRYALDSHLPLLAICRGMQVMNIALGGTIYQDLSLRPFHTLQHMQISRDRRDLSHGISISPGSHLCRFLGTSSRVKPAAIASDGVVEAVELVFHPFALGVQWHPEVLWPSDKAMEKIFLTLIEKSSNSKNIQYIPSSSRAE